VQKLPHSVVFAMNAAETCAISKLEDGANVHFSSLFGQRPSSTPWPTPG